MSCILKTKFILTLLALLFLGRVVGQLVVRAGDLSWLPPDALWHAGAVPFEALLVAQVVILVAMTIAVWKLDHIRPRPDLAVLLMWGAVAYGLVMTGRGLVGVLALSDAAWFDAPISTPFHLVLAGWVFTFAYHLAHDERRKTIRRAMLAITRTAGYPVIMIACVTLYFWLLRHDMAPKFAAYLPVILGASAILILELATPYRRSWLPDRREVFQDALFMFVVQIALPALITLAIVDLVAGELDGFRVGLWPHDWPIAAQALLMLLAADLLRYWLHRASHGWRWLWRLHAIHHSPTDLYFLNVGRFHPIEKCLQFALDAAPFLLLGVQPEVVAAYFVFYAVNGFFQHSNVDLRLGWLNWIVSGPELHRWHHSRKIKESDRNFGNNLIVWDAIFGTRFLPDEREVSELGLKNRDYPKDFVGQTLAPIMADPNKS